LQSLQRLSEQIQALLLERLDGYAFDTDSPGLDALVLA
jgi:hypothetical protein